MTKTHEDGEPFLAEGFDPDLLEGDDEDEEEEEEEGSDEEGESPEASKSKASAKDEEKPRDPPPPPPSKKVMMSAIEWAFEGQEMLEPGLLERYCEHALLLLKAKPGSQSHGRHGSEGSRCEALLRLLATLADDAAHWTTCARPRHRSGFSGNPARTDRGRREIHAVRLDREEDQVRAELHREDGAQKCDGSCGASRGSPAHESVRRCGRARGE